MHDFRVGSVAVALVAALFSCVFSSVAQASFHLWGIKEVFTSADGAVQFVELFTTSSGQQFLNGHNIVITSDGVAKTVTFDHHLPGSSANKHFLVATSGFGALNGGVTPDYTPVSGNLFDPNATNITFDFAHGFDVLNVMGSQIPKDGVNSVHDAAPSGPESLSTGPNSPTNFAGAAGSVNLGGGTPIPGDFNGDNVVDGADLTAWGNNFGATGSPAVSQGNADADGDVDGRDFLIWQRNVGGASSVAAASAIPEPASALLAALAGATLLGAASRKRKRPELSAQVGRFSAPLTVATRRR